MVAESVPPQFTGVDAAGQAPKFPKAVRLFQLLNLTPLAPPLTVIAPALLRMEAPPRLTPYQSAWVVDPIRSIVPVPRDSITSDPRVPE